MPLHISTNGQGFAQRLEEYVQASPVVVEEIVVVAHSMGGLVMRSVRHAAEQTNVRRGATAGSRSVRSELLVATSARCLSVFTACLCGGRAGFVVVAADVGAAVVVVAFVVGQFSGGELARGSAGSWRSWLASMMPSA